jgi:formylglycine-generating enzyme required for sulfatase activity
MLQAREYACILLLTVSVPAPEHLFAQNDDSEETERQLNRLGDSAIENDFELDLTVPVSGETDAASPEEPGTAETAATLKAREQSDRESRIERLLTAASAAVRAGRFDQPPDDCAWTHYQAVLDIDPENAEALSGLVRVQEEMVKQAMSFAHDLDFESAERVLEDAALVRESRDLIDDAYEDMLVYRRQHAAELELKALQAMDLGDFSQAERALIELVALGDVHSTINQLRRRMEEARIYGGFKPGQTIKDHFINQGMWTPELIIVLAGSFVMGSSAFEDGRKDNEGPEHRVTFRRGFAIGRTEISVAQFREFVDWTAYRTDAEKFGHSFVYDHYSGRLMQKDGVTWEHSYEGREANENDPVVHVSWNDATAYARWLTQGTGKTYRLPTEAEFEYAQRAGKPTPYWWGEGSPSRVVENLTGERDSSRGRRRWDSFFKGYGDKFWGPAPVASFEANPFGLYDIGGNVGEWVMDCWHDTYIRAPLDGSAWINPGCKLRVVRGGYWASSPDQARSAHRLSSRPDRRDGRIGFRIVRDL